MTQVSPHRLETVLLLLADEVQNQTCLQPEGTPSTSVPRRRPPTSPPPSGKIRPTASIVAIMWPSEISSMGTSSAQTASGIPAARQVEDYDGAHAKQKQRLLQNFAKLTTFYANHLKIQPIRRLHLAAILATALAVLTFPSLSIEVSQLIARSAAVSHDVLVREGHATKPEIGWYTHG
jgi:hypothetical protein